MENTQIKLSETVMVIEGQCKNLRGNICKNPIFA